MTNAELLRIIADPKNPAVWSSPDMTNEQLQLILAAIAPSPPYVPPDHLQTAGATPTGSYIPADGGALGTISGTDSAGAASVTSGTGFNTQNQILRIVFAVPFTSTPSAVAVLDTPTLGSMVTVVQASTTTLDIYLNAMPPSTTITIRWIAAGAPN